MERIVIRAAAAVLGATLAGPAGALAAWKLGGFATSGNPLHLIPGAGVLADAQDAADAFAVTDASLDPGESKGGGGKHTWGGWF